MFLRVTSPFSIRVDIISSATFTYYVSCYGSTLCPCYWGMDDYEVSNIVFVRSFVCFVHSLPFVECGEVVMGDTIFVTFSAKFSIERASQPADIMMSTRVQTSCFCFLKHDGSRPYTVIK